MDKARMWGTLHKRFVVYAETYSSYVDNSSELDGKLLHTGAVTVSSCADNP